MTTEPASDGTPPPGGMPLIPPDGFVTAFNARAMANGQPFRSALDPLVMMAWHLASGTADAKAPPIILPEC